MANLNYTTPATVVITNNAVPVEAFDAGTRFVAVADAVIADPALTAELYNADTNPSGIKTSTNYDRTNYIVKPVQATVDGVEVVTLGLVDVPVVKYKTGDRTIQLFKTNTFLTLKSGQSVTLVAATAAEAAFFADLATDEITVTITAIVVTPDTILSIVPVTGISNIAGYTDALEIDDTLQLTGGVAAPTGATNKDVKWSSSNTAVATVSQTGLVTAIGAGTCEIIAVTEDGAFSDTQTVVVNAGT